LIVQGLWRVPRKKS